jgi:hypothetical protein
MVQTVKNVSHQLKVVENHKEYGILILQAANIVQMDNLLMHKLCNALMIVLPLNSVTEIQRGAHHVQLIAKHVQVPLYAQNVMTFST